MNQKAYLSRLNIIELQDKIWLSGIVIKGRQIPQNGKSKLSHFFFVLGSYFKTPLKGISLQASLGDSRIMLTTDSKGSFSELVNSKMPANINFFYEQEELRRSEAYPAFFPLGDSEYEVISDLDDTVLVSHTASAFKRIRNILFLAPKKKKTVLFTFHLMQEFKEKLFRVHYLSKSESNLYQVIADFIEYHDLPKGSLLLSPHLKWKQLINPRKGKDYKLKQIKELLRNLPDKKFILLGDDTQRDMDVYTQAITEFKDQVRLVFIRQTRISRTERQEEMWNKLVKTGVEAYYFDDREDPEMAISKIREL